MDGKSSLEVRDVQASHVVSRRAQPTADALQRRSPELSSGWAWFAGLVGPAIMAVSVAVEPAPAEPEAAGFAIGGLLFVALLGSWWGAAANAMRRQRKALEWAALAGLLSLVLTVACPVSDHHVSIGAWWFVQPLRGGR